MRIIQKIVLSAFIILLCLAGLSKVYDVGLRHNNDLKSAYVLKGTINADLLIHGPCEPLWMISPAILDKQTGLRSYNLALSHSDFADNYLHLYLYLKHNKAPRYMLLYVTPESMDANYNTFNTYAFAECIGDPVIDSVVKECDPQYYKWSLLPFMKYAYYSNKISFNALQGWKHYLSGKQLPYYADGYEPPAEVVWDNHLEDFIHLYPQGYNFKWDALREKYLRKIIVLAKQHGINISLFESPVLREALRYQPNRVATIAKIKGVANDYDVEYVQFENMKIADSRKYYMSTLNTNLEGSKIFTDTLGCFLKTRIIK